MATLLDGPVLIVDDSEVVREVLTDMLGAVGCKDIHSARDGKTGLDAYHELRPKLVFLDITMPEIPGTKLANQILKHDPRAKIVLVTAVSRDHELVESAIGQGVTAYLRKPVRLADVEALLEHLDAEQSRVAAARSDASSPTRRPNDDSET